MESRLIAHGHNDLGMEWRIPAAIPRGVRCQLELTINGIATLRGNARTSAQTESLSCLRGAGRPRSV